MSKDDKTEIVVSVLGLEKIFTPTMEYAGEQLLELVKFLVESARSRLQRSEDSDTFQFIPARGTYLILEHGAPINELPIKTTASVNPFSILPKWDWPLRGKGKDHYIDTILSKTNLDVDREVFLNALCSSLSLNQKEKQRVIDAWPTLSQFQVDGLLEVFREEKHKFENDIFPDHPRDIWSLLFARQMEWSIIVLRDRRVGLESFLVPPLNGDLLFPYFAFWPEYWQKVGSLLMDEVKDYRAASRAFQQACYLTPENAYSWARLGYCYCRLGYFDFGLKCFEKTLELRPDNKIMLLDICEIHIIKNRYLEARNSISETLDEIPDSYKHCHYALDWLITILEKNIWVEPPEYLQEFVNDIENESPWYWQDLKGVIETNDNLDNSSKKKITRFLQRLIALS